MVATARPSLRKDAHRNREAIMSAARELFAESGDVPMFEIGRRAGVGQGTLYRNFPERSALMAALLAEVMDEWEHLAADVADDPDAFFIMLRHIVEAQVGFQGLVEGLHDARAGESEIAPLKQRLTKLFRRPLRDAKAAGALRRQRQHGRRVSGDVDGRRSNRQGGRSIRQGCSGRPSTDVGPRRPDPRYGLTPSTGGS